MRKIEPSYIYSIKSEGNLNSVEFTLGNDNIPTVNFNDGSGFNSYGLSNEGFKPGVEGQKIEPSVNHLSGAENLVIDYITNTDHQDSDYQYTIVAAHEISNAQNSSVYYVGGADKKTLIPLFSLNPQTFSESKNNKKEDNTVNGFYSYSDNINQNYNLVVTTSNSVYQYSYTIAKDISLGGQARKILFVDTSVIGQREDPIYTIARNSIIYSDDQLKYIFTDSEKNVNSYIGSIFEKLNLSTINTNDLTYKPDYPLNGSEQYEKDMIEKLESGLKTGQLSKDQKVTKMFEESEDGDYKIYLEESERNKLIPENKFGKIQASGEFVIEAGDTPTSRFRGAKRQTVIADYKNRFNLSELANQNSQFKVWEDGYELNKYDDFNSVIGWVYNQVQNSLEKINGFQNEVMWKELESTEWEINNWQNGAKADNFNSGWGLFGANSISTFNEETGKTQVVLNGIKIQPKKGPDSDYFYVENGSEENKQTYVELPKLVINVDLSKTTIDGESTAAGSILNEKNKLDLNEKAKGVSKLQFNGIGLTTENTLENRIKIQNRLNKHLSLDPALGLQLININSNNYYSFEQISSKITVRLFDRAFAVDGASTAVESSNKQGYNYTTIEITIYGLKKPSSLPRWVTPILAFGGLSIFILLIMSAWFISRKRFYKSAVGKEAAKIAQAKRREEKTKK
ncbi:hypothetical protein [Spiroplasma endosymbiont of Diplazon laetatorius]|uniref:hypothetical protein n=1 Tax=Spiroplasma endosymbiont of Diplazon laetatorius TaxID=3066322 RepID=UPI0030CA7AFC